MTLYVSAGFRTRLKICLIIFSLKNRKLLGQMRGKDNPMEQLNSNSDKKSSSFLFRHTVVTALS